MGWFFPPEGQEGGQPLTLFLAKRGHRQLLFLKSPKPLHADSPPSAHPPSAQFEASNHMFPFSPVSLQDTFVELYGNNAAAESRKGQERFNRWFLTGMTLAGVVLLGSLFSRK